jgi:hypothetical protein
MLCDIGAKENPEATEAVIVDGWFNTRDMATIDKEGMIEVVDRKKDLIISVGENVSSMRCRARRRARYRRMCCGRSIGRGEKSA